MHWFSVESTAAVIWGYPLSWLELVGTVFNLWSVWLMTRNRILTWPVGLVGVALFLLLFWQIRLYADVFEQVYYLITGCWGWWLWRRSGVPNGGPICRGTWRQNGMAVAITAVLSALAGWANSRLHLWLPALFPEEASFPYVDATTTVMSFTAQLLMARRRLECWPIWIAVDVVGIWLYWQKGVVFVAMLYGVFLVLATRGLMRWWEDLDAV